MADKHLIADISIKAWIRLHDQVLFVQESEGQWTLPGGRMHVGELPKETLTREVKEETSLDIDVGDIIDCNVFTSKSGMHHFIVVFSANVKPDQQPKVDGTEIREISWVQMSDIRQLNLRAEYRPIVDRLVV